MKPYEKPYENEKKVNVIYLKHLIQALEDPEEKMEDKATMLKIAVKTGTITENQAIDLLCDYWADALISK